MVVLTGVWTEDEDLVRRTEVRDVVSADVMTELFKAAMVNDVESLISA